MLKLSALEPGELGSGGIVFEALEAPVLARLGEFPLSVGLFAFINILPTP